jgi:hypothetical protein
MPEKLPRFHPNDKPAERDSASRSGFAARKLLGDFTAVLLG